MKKSALFPIIIVVLHCLTGCSQDASQTAFLLLGTQPVSYGNGDIIFSIGDDTAINLYKINQNGKGLTQLTSDPGASFGASFSPDGSRIVYASSKNHLNAASRYQYIGDLVGEEAQPADIFIMNADGSDRRQLTSTVEHDSDPIFSPDGRTIYFKRSRDFSKVHSRVANGSRVDSDLYAIDIAGKGLKRLTQEDFWALFAPSLVEGGQYLLTKGDVYFPTDAGKKLLPGNLNLAFILVNVDGSGELKRVFPDLKKLYAMGSDKKMNDKLGVAITPEKQHYLAASGMHFPLAHPQGHYILFTVNREIYKWEGQDVDQVGVFPYRYRSYAFLSNKRENCEIIYAAATIPSQVAPDSLWRYNLNSQKHERIFHVNELDDK